MMPAIFLGHGNPMNALLRNPYSEAWRVLGAALPRPRAIIAVSAHWYTADTRVTLNAQPRTIHDFGGFPPELYRVQYPAPGEPGLARSVRALLDPIDVKLDESWGLDHGSWSVLRHLYPQADVPVIQLSINETEPAEFHFALGEKLAPLREDGVLILGSGNLVHNLHAYAWGRHPQEPYDWALRFEAVAKQSMLERNYQRLIAYEQLGPDAMLSIPTPDHYLPLLYVLGSAQDDEAITFPVSGVDGGSISMLSVQVG
jgi:4,5-DOPA dioxygenase extradiol